MADYLTHDLIRKILSKLPVASLLRFKEVSPGWNAIISDPQFIQTYEGDSDNLFLAEDRTNHTVSLARLEGEGYRIEEVIKRKRIMCTANGMVLCQSNLGYKTYVLWNACTKQTTLIGFPYYYPYANDNLPFLWGLCPDPTNNDCKIVIAYWDFSVYSCNKQSWTSLRKCPRYATAPCHTNSSSAGVFVDGAIYWFVKGNILYFDPKDDSFKIQEKPKEVKGKQLYVMDWKGCLCFYYCRYENPTIHRFSAHFWVKEKGSVNSWKKLMVIDDLTVAWSSNFIQLEEDKILMRTHDSTRFVVYNTSTMSFTEHCMDEIIPFIFPYRESLWFPPPTPWST